MTKIDDIPDAQVCTLAARQYLKDEKKTKLNDRKIAYFLIGFITGAVLFVFTAVLK